MIIGINGKIGSGKDTVCTIIQWLTNPRISTEPNIDMKEDSFITYQSFKDYQEEWKDKDVSTNIFIRKKFAYKLKQICSILTSIPVEDFEKQKVKDTILPDEWNYAIENSRVIAIKEAKKEYEGVWNEKFVKKYTIRELLQRVGTEAMREQIHPNIWINALFSDYKSEYTLIAESYSTNNPLPVKEPTNELAQNPNWIITDVRFPNEANAIKERGGKLIRINRPDIYDSGIKTFNPVVGVTNMSNNYKKAMRNEHPSETALDSYKDWDYTIDNNGTIEDLIKAVRKILIIEKIIT